MGFIKKIILISLLSCFVGIGSVYGKKWADNINGKVVASMDSTQDFHIINEVTASQISNAGKSGLVGAIRAEGYRNEARKRGASYVSALKVEEFILLPLHSVEEYLLSNHNMKLYKFQKVPANEKEVNKFIYTNASKKGVSLTIVISGEFGLTYAGKSHLFAVPETESTQYAFEYNGSMSIRSIDKGMLVQNMRCTFNKGARKKMKPAIATLAEFKADKGALLKKEVEKFTGFCTEKYITTLKKVL